MIAKFKNILLSKKIEIIILIILYCLIAFTVIFNLYVIMNMGYSVLEVRDNACVKVVSSLANGINPYSINYLTSDEAPRVLLDSGFFNLLPAVPLVMLGMKATTATYLINFIYLLLASLMMFKTVKLLTYSRILSALSVLLSFSFFNRKYNISARPDNLCALIIVAIIYLLCQEQFKNNLSDKRMHVYALLCVLLALLKVHYSIIILTLLIYFFIFNKKLFYKLILCGALYTLIYIGILMVFFPTHLPIWIIRIYEMFDGVNNMSRLQALNISFFKHICVAKQFRIFYIMSFIGFIAFIVGAIKSQNAKEFILENKIDLFFIINITINATALLFLGAHLGAGYWYYYFMLVPSVVIYGMKSLQILKYSKIYKEICVICIALPFCMPTIYSANALPNFKNNETSFKEAEAIIQQYESEDMFLAMYLSGYSIQNNIYNFSNGDEIYVPQKIDSQLFNSIFPQYNLLVDKHTEYINQIDENIKNKKYSLVVPDFEFTPNNLEKYYTKVKEITILNITTEFYIPKQE